MNYYIKTKKIHTSFEQAVQLVTEALYAEGFVVLTAINMHDKLKENLGVNFRRYKILSAYNPDYAYKALLEEDKIGVMLPCNVIIQEDTDGTIEIAAGNPVASMLAVENPQLIDIAIGIEKKLETIIDNLNSYLQTK
jgi:uncharacterized protein (DUF302 family)